MDNQELRKFLIQLIDVEFSPNPAAIAPKWEGGSLIMRPSGDQQEKEVPIEVFFKKITSMRESLRVLEQKINNHDALSTADKATFQSYITKCYGTMTTFNVLFRDSGDRFIGTGGDKAEGEVRNKATNQKLTLSEAKAKLGLNEYKRD
jgi:hypothetical protein